MKCDRCGATLEVGSWPFCDASKHAQVESFGFDAFEPYYDKHILSRKSPDDPGTFIASRSDRRAIMKANGLDFGTEVARGAQEHKHRHGRIS